MTPAAPHHQLRITLLQERSAGTFARVYLAEATGEGDISRIVAVKVLKEQWAASEELLTRTHDEARLLARLRHKNILRVEAMAEIDGQPAIVMEFVDGIDLKQLIDLLAAERAAIPRRSVYSIALGATSALQAAYAKVPYGRGEPLRVVHRDLKPSNVMISVEGEVKVLDFGTARFTHEARLAKTGVLRFGSMKYMSPERRLGDRGEHASDVYALGLLLIEMLRGEQLPLLPIDRAEHDDALAEVIGRLDNLGLPNEAWEDSLRQMLLRMCHFETEGRLDAGQVVELLRAFADQAAGSGLETWSSQVVSRLTRNVYGDGIDGALSGSQVFVNLSAGGAGVGSQGVVRRSPLSPAAANASAPGGSGPPGVITRNGPTMGRPVDVHAPPGGALNGGAPIATPSPLADEPTMVQSSPAFDDDIDLEPDFRPGYTEPEGLPAQPTLSSAPIGPDAADPPPAAAMAAAGIRAGAPAGGTSAAPPTTAAPSPPLDAAGGRSGLVLAIAGGTLAALLALGAVGIAGAWWWSQRDAAPATAEADGAPEADTLALAGTDAAAEAPTDVTVQLTADGAALQWVKLTDAEGDTVARAKPTATATVAPGAYTLSGKLVGRSSVSATLSVEEDVDVSCAEQDAGKIRCEVGDETLHLE